VTSSFETAFPRVVQSHAGWGSESTVIQLAKLQFDAVAKGNNTAIFRTFGRLLSLYWGMIERGMKSSSSRNGEEGDRGGGGGGGGEGNAGAASLPDNEGAADGHDKKQGSSASSTPPLRLLDSFFKPLTAEILDAVFDESGNDQESGDNNNNKKTTSELIEFFSGLLKPMNQKELARAMHFCKHKDDDENTDDSKPKNNPVLEEIINFMQKLQLHQMLHKQYMRVPKIPAELAVERTALVRTAQVVKMMADFFKAEEEEEEDCTSSSSPSPSSSYVRRTLDRNIDFASMRSNLVLYHIKFDYAAFCTAFMLLKRILTGGGSAVKAMFMMTHAANACDRLQLLPLKIRMLTIVLKGYDFEIQRDEIQFLQTHWESYIAAKHNLGVAYISSDGSKALQIFKETLKDLARIKHLFTNNIQVSPGDVDANRDGTLQDTEIQIKTRIAHVYGEKGDWKEKKKILLELAEQAELLYGSKHKKYAQICNQVGECTTALGEYVTAEKYLIESIQVGRSLGFVPSSHLFNLANLYTRYGKHDQVLQIMQEAVRVDEQMHGKESLAVTVPLRKLAQTIGLVGDTEEQLKIMQRCYSIYRKHGVQHGKEYAFVLQNLGIAWMDKGLKEGGFDFKTGMAFEKGDSLKNLKKAKALMEQAVTILKQSIDERHPDVGTAKINLGNCIGYLGENERKIGLQMEAMKSHIAVTGTENHSSVAELYANIGRTYSTMQRYEEAEKAMQKAYDINCACVGPLHNGSQWMMRRLNEIRAARQEQGFSQYSNPQSDNPFAEGVEQIKAMGIQKTDQEISHALLSADGDISTAVAILLS